jgi:hypothetical protein
LIFSRSFFLPDGNHGAHATSRISIGKPRRRGFLESSLLAPVRCVIAGVRRHGRRENLDVKPGNRVSASASACQVAPRGGFCGGSTTNSRLEGGSRGSFGTMARGGGAWSVSRCSFQEASGFPEIRALPGCSFFLTTAKLYSDNHGSRERIPRTSKDTVHVRHGSD